MGSISSWLIGFIFIVSLNACSTGQVKTAKPLELNSTDQIAIKISATNATLDTETIKQQVGKNLADWDYPIGEALNHRISHYLEALIGTVEHGNTPMGFSFSMGNSDPRALDFQKADVLPITCRLSSALKTEQQAEMTMGFNDSEVTKANPDSKELADHISTVCFNFLRELAWPIKKPASGTNEHKSGWIPEIRIETQNEETPAQLSPNPVNRPNPSTKPSGQEPKTVTKEITKSGRKVYIIHNQGNPILFQFGHERK